MEPTNSKPQLIFRPNPGRQSQALASKADIVIYGGAASGGKTFALLLDPLRHHQKPGYNAVIFRRTYSQVTQQGGIWDATFNIYPHFGGKPNESDLVWTFPPANAQIGFAHLQHDKNQYDYQGAELDYLGWDEVTHQNEAPFWYLTSRCRSRIGLRTKVFATCNPDPDHFIKPLISWWLDPAGQFPDPAKAGIVRYFVRDPYTGQIIWHDTDHSLFMRLTGQYIAEDPNFKPTSLTFIPASLDDNPQADPAYKSKLLSLPMIERQRLLYGDWKIKASAGTLFKSEWFQFSDRLPKDIKSYCRYWDRAATEKTAKNDPDYTAGVLMARTANGTHWIIDVKQFRGSPLEVENQIFATANTDRELYGRVEVGIEQDPGQAGKFEASYYSRVLSGFNVRLYPAKQSKIKRAEPFSAQCEAGNVFLLRSNWNHTLIHELEQFPDGNHDDIVDSCSGAFSALQKSVTRIGSNWI